MNEYYPGRSQTLAKHAILQRYLEQFAFKVGRTFGSFDFIDGFSGPWEERDTDEFSDTSFGIALRQLQVAAEKLTDQGQRVNIRCIFNEKDKTSYDRLSGYLERAKNEYPLVDIQALCGPFSDNAERIRRLATYNFQLLFVDPTGWTGFPPSSISNVLSGRNSELIVNFMQEHITRFLTSPTDAQENGLLELFGRNRAARYIGQHPSIEDIEREYRSMMMEEFDFRFVASSPIYMEDSNKLHFRLMYGTNHPAGISLLRDVEVKSLKEHDQRKSSKKQDPLQGSLFSITDEDLVVGPYGLEREQHLKFLADSIATNLVGRGRNLSFQRLQADIQCNHFVRTTEIKDAVVELAEQGRVEATWKLRGANKKKPENDDRIYLL